MIPLHSFLRRQRTYDRARFVLKPEDSRTNEARFYVLNYLPFYVLSVSLQQTRPVSIIVGWMHGLSDEKGNVLE